MRSFTEKCENFEVFARKKDSKESKKKKKFNKIEAILDLQENDEKVFRRNQKKILPKINRNVTHSINDLLNLK